jgi:hypothetical protein
VDILANFSISRKSGNMKKIILLILTIFAAVEFGYSQNKVIVDYSLGFDSDKLNNHQYSISYHRKFSKEFLGGMSIGRYTFTEKNENTQKTNFNYVGFYTNSRIWRDSVLRFEGFINLANNKKWLLPLYSLTIKYKPIKFIYVELFFSRDLLGTEGALKENLTVYSNGVSSDFIFLKGRLSFVGAYIYQNFTDDNIRDVKIVRVIGYPTKWFNLQLTSKLTSMNERSPYYFSPESFDTYMGGSEFVIVLFNDNFSIKPFFGYGKQIIDSENKNFYDARIKMVGWIKGQYGFNINFGYTNAANEYGEYNYSYGSIKFIYDIKKK